VRKDSTNQMVLDYGVLEEQEYLFGKFHAYSVNGTGKFSPRQLLDWLGNEPVVALDFETVTPDGTDINSFEHFSKAQIVITALSHRGGTLILYAPVPPPGEPLNRDWPELLALLSNRTLVVHNAAYDITLYHQVTGILPERVIDTMVLYGLVTSGRAYQQVMRSQSLATAVMTAFQFPMSKEVRETFLNQELRYVTEEQCRYAAEDVRWTFLLAAKLLQACQEHQILHIADLECKLTPVLIRMKIRGVEIDLELTRKYRERLKKLENQLENEILDIMQHDSYTVLGFTDVSDGRLAQPVTMQQAVHAIRGSEEERSQQIRALYRPTSLLGVHEEEYHRQRARYYHLPLKPISEVVNIRSSQLMQSYMYLLSGGRITSSNSRQLESFSFTLQTGKAATVYPKDYAQLIPTLLEKIVHYRGVGKIRSTYLSAWETLSQDGRIHTTFLQTYAESGRLSSRNPNLQNCPRPDTTQFLEAYLGEALDMRSMVIAPPGKVLVTADYSQYELRIAAERANEPLMLDTYQRAKEVLDQIDQLLWERYKLHPWQYEEISQLQDEELKNLQEQLESLDFHVLNAARIFKKDPREVTKQERKEAKAISFGVLYSMQSASLAETIQRLTQRAITVEEAQSLLDNYFKTYWNLHQYIQRTIFHSKNRGYVTSIIGRKRWCDYPRYRTRQGLRGLLNSITAGIEREAINHTIQSTNADATKWALVLLDQRLREANLGDAYPVLTVHDEIVVEAPEEYQHEVAKILQECMLEGSRLAGVTKVPTVVEVSIAKSWKK